MTQIAQRAYAQSKANLQQHHIGQLATVQYFGRMITGKIIEVLHAVHLVKQLRSQDINCHIEEVRDRSNEAWQYDAPFNSQFLGAQPARAGQDY